MPGASLRAAPGASRSSVLSSAPEGLIRVDAPAAFGRRHLAPAIADFLAAYPGLDVQLRLIDSFVDLHGSHLGEVDLILRAGPWPTPAWWPHPWRTWCALPAPAPPTWPAAAYRPAPANCRSTTAWTGTDWLPFAWRFTVDGQARLYRPARMRMAANNAETLLFGALAGLGIAHLPTWLISDYLLRGELVPLFCDNGLPPAESSGIYAMRLAHETNSRSRLLLEFLKSRFSPIPPWDLALRSELRG